MNPDKPILKYSFSIPTISIHQVMLDLEKEIERVEAEILEISMLLDDDITDFSDAKRELTRIFNV